MRTCFRITCLLLVAALVAGSPASADAASKKVIIKPNALAPLVTQQNDTRMGILNSGPGTFFWATLKIPVNAKITGVSYRRWATAASKSNVAVDRVRPGTTPSWQRIYDGQSTEISPAGSTGTTVVGTYVGPTKKVQAGWDYFVLTYTETNIGVGDITVKYETP